MRRRTSSAARQPHACLITAPTQGLQTQMGPALRLTELAETWQRKSAIQLWQAISLGKFLGGTAHAVERRPGSGNTDQPGHAHGKLVQAFLAARHALGRAAGTELPARTPARA